MSQIAEANFLENKILAVESTNKIVAPLKNNRDLSLKFSKLVLDSISIRFHANASPISNYAQSSQLEYMIFVGSKYKLCLPIRWTSHKSKLVPRCIPDSAVMAFSDAFELAYKMKYDLHVMTSKYIRWSMVTDSLSLSDILTKSTMTFEERLVVYLKTFKKSYLKMKLHHVAFISSEYMLADPLIKANPSHSLFIVWKTCTIDHLLNNG